MFCNNARKNLQGPKQDHNNRKGCNNLKKFSTSDNQESLQLYDLIYLFGRLIWKDDSQRVSIVISNLQTWTIYCDLRISNKLMKYLNLKILSVG